MLVVLLGTLLLTPRLAMACTHVRDLSLEQRGPDGNPDPGVSPGSSSKASGGAPSGSLASTGVAGLVMALTGLVLLLLGAVLTLATGRRRGTTMLLIGLAMLAGTSLFATAAPAGAQSTSADGCPSDPGIPTPVVPETPLPVLLPVAGLALTAGVLVVSRRRRTIPSNRPDMFLVARQGEGSDADGSPSGCT